MTKCFYLERTVNNSLQVLIIEGETEEEAKIKIRKTNKKLIEGVFSGILDIPAERLSKGKHELVKLVLSKYDILKREDGENNRFYRHTGGLTILIVGKLSKKILPKFNKRFGNSQAVNQQTQ